MVATPANPKEVIIIRSDGTTTSRPATKAEYEKAKAPSSSSSSSQPVFRGQGMSWDTSNPKSTPIQMSIDTSRYPIRNNQAAVDALRKQAQPPQTFQQGQGKSWDTSDPGNTPIQMSIDTAKYPIKDVSRPQAPAQPQAQTQTAQQVQEPQKPRTFLTGDTKTSLVRTPSFQQSQARPQEQPQDNRIDLNKNIVRQVREHPLTQHYKSQYEKAKSIFEPKLPPEDKRTPDQNVYSVRAAALRGMLFTAPEFAKDVTRAGLNIAEGTEDMLRGNIKSKPAFEGIPYKQTAQSKYIDNKIYTPMTPEQQQASLRQTAKELTSPLMLAEFGGSLVGGAVLSKGAAALLKSSITTSIVKSDIVAKSVSGETKLASVTASETKMPYPFRNIKTVSESQTITRAVPEKMVTDVAGLTKEAGFIKQFKTDITGKTTATEPMPYTARSVVSKETDKIISTQGTIQKGTAYKKFETYLAENKAPAQGKAILGTDLATTEKNYIRTTESNVLFDKGHARNIISEYTGDMKTMSGFKAEPIKPKASSTKNSFAEQAVSQQEQTLHQTAGAGAIAAHEELVTKITTPRIKAAQYSAQAPSIMHASISPYADTKSPSPFSKLTNKNPYAMTTVYKPSTVAATFQIGKLQTMTQSTDQMTENIIKTKNIQASKFAQQQESIQKKMQGMRSGQTQGQITKMGQEQSSMFKQEQAQMQKQGQLQKQLQKQMNIARTNTLTRTMITPKIKVPFVMPHLDFSKGARFIPQVPRVGFVPQFFLKGGGFKMGNVGFKEPVSAQSFAARESLRSKDIIGFKLVQAEAQRYKSGMTKVNPSDMRMLFNMEKGGFIEKPSSMNPSRLSSFNFAKFMNRKG